VVRAVCSYFVVSCLCGKIIMEEWRFLDTGANNGSWNMAVDEAIFITTKEKNLSPTLRFYRWRPSAVSIGYAQNVGEEVNLKECRRLRMDVVRRYTGGGAIFHENELTYSFISKTDGYQDFDDLLASYKQVCWGIIKGLSGLGISAKFRGEKSRSSYRDDIYGARYIGIRRCLPHCGKGLQTLNASDKSDPYKVRKKVPCFMANSKHDLIVDEKKVLGNAQRRTKEVFLQQGSLPLSYDFNLINRIFPGSNGFKNRATSISEILDQEISLGEIKEKLLFGFTSHFSVNFREGTLSEEEQSLARKLFKEKYSSKDWTLNRLPRKHES